MTESGYSRDALRLLYAIGAYSNPDGDLSNRVWLKMHSICVVALLGVKSGVFQGYDVAPALFPFRGIKMFAMISQEAIEDVQSFFRNKHVDKVLLNTWFYSTITGVAVTADGQNLIDEFVTEDDRLQIDRIIYCAKCRSPLDFAVEIQHTPRTHMVMNRVCRCQTGGRHIRDDEWFSACGTVDNRVEDFFSIGEIEYRAEPFFMDTSL